MGGLCDKDATNFCQAEHRAEPVGEQPDLHLTEPATWIEEDALMPNVATRATKLPAA